MSEPSLPRGVIFDMDGLMLESEELWTEVDRAVTREYGLRFDPTLKPLFMGCEKKESARRFCDAYGLSEAPDVIIRKRLALAYRFYRENVQLMPGLPGLVEDLKAWGKPLAVATSADRGIVTIVRDKFDIFASFQAIVCADDVKRGKPAPDLFLEAAARLNVPAAGSVVLEDSPNGVTAALSAGMRVIGVPNPDLEKGQMREADLLVNKLEEISRDRIRALFRSEG